MSSKSTGDVSGTNLIDERFERLSDEAMSLRITDKFFTEVERWLLRRSAPAFDVSIIKESLRAINPKSGEPDRKQIEQRLQKQFALWREALTKKDAAIEAFHIRRFCDAMQASLNETIFHAVSRFYRSIPLSANSQSKFDLVITRAFGGFELVGRIRASRFDRQEMKARIRNLYSEWPETNAGLETDGASAAARFDEFIAEARGLAEFEGLIGANIFERIRSFKRDLGPDFFAPECVAAAVECNIVVGNVFSSLLSNLNSNLHLRLNSQIDFAGALLDGETETNAVLLDIMSGFMSDTDAHISISGNPDLVFLRSLLRHAESIPAEYRPDDDNEEIDEETVETVETVGPVLVKTRLAAQLATLSHPQPDIAVLREYMSRSAYLDSLNLNDFLFYQDGRADVLGRRAMAAILCLEEIKENDLKNNKQIEPEIGDEMVALLNFAERIGEDLTAALHETDEHTQNRLLLITNNLLSTRLQVERAVVKFTSPVEEPVLIETAAEKGQNESTAESFEITMAPLKEANRWLMAATVIVVLLFGSIMLFSGGTSSAALPEDVEEVMVEKLPKSEHLEQAFRKKTTLFVTAKESWEKLKDEDKRWALQKMSETELSAPVQVVIVIDPTGRPLGDISHAGITIHAEPPMSVEAN